MSNKFSKKLPYKLLKLYYKELSIIKLEKKIKLLKTQSEPFVIRSQETDNEIKNNF